MISYLSGNVILLKSGFVIIEVNGVGYKVITNPSAPFKDGERANLFIHHHFRENSQELYGFLAYGDLNLFEKLITVNGVGPKMAMQLLTSVSSSQVTEAITGDNLSFFTAIPGIGKKVAAKIILELKHKISQSETIGLISGFDAGDEVAEVLVGLGYKKFEITKVTADLPGDINSSEEKIKWCLKKMAKTVKAKKRAT